MEVVSFEAEESFVSVVVVEEDAPVSFFSSEDPFDPLLPDLLA